jgi:alanine racemase
MDMVAIDLTNCPEASVGDLVTLWGGDLTVEEVASHSANINYDILTGIQNRVKFTWL